MLVKKFMGEVPQWARSGERRGLVTFADSLQGRCREDLVARSRSGRQRSTVCCAMSFLLAVLMLAAPGADWPRFRGPNGAGLQDGTPLPAQFGASRNVV